MSLWTGDEIWFLELKQHFLLWSSSSVWSTEIRLSPSLSNLCSHSPSLNLSLARSPCSIWAWGIAAWDGELMKKGFFFFFLARRLVNSGNFVLCFCKSRHDRLSCFTIPTPEPVKHKYLTSLFSSPWEYILNNCISCYTNDSLLSFAPKSGRTASVPVETIPATSCLLIAFHYTPSYLHHLQEKNSSRAPPRSHAHSHTHKWPCLHKLQVRCNIVKKPLKMLSSNMEADVGWCWQRGYVSSFLRDW